MLLNRRVSAAQSSFAFVVLFAMFVPVALCLAEGAPGPPSVALHWARGPGAERCVSPTELVAALEGRFGPTFVNPARAEQVLEGSVSLTSSGYVVLLRVTDDHGHVRGERRFVNAERDCVALGRQLVLVISLLLDPEGRWDARLPGVFGEESTDPGLLLLGEIAAQPSAPSVGSVVKAAAPAPAPVTKPEPSAPRLPSLLGLDALGGVGIDARASVGLRLRLDVPFSKRWTLETGAVADLPRTHGLEGGASLRTQLLAAWFGGCPRAWGQTLRFAGCAGGSLGAQRLEAEGLLGTAAPDWSLAIGAWLDLRLSVQLTPVFGLAAGAVAYVPLLQGKPTYGAPGEPPRTVFDPLYLSGWAYLSGFVSL